MAGVLPGGPRSRDPRKEFVPFPSSGHVACFEEPRRFLEVMLRVKAVFAPEGVHPAP